MIIILSHTRHRGQAEIIRDEFRGVFGDAIHVELLPAETTSTWQVGAAWDDMLVVLFDEQPLGGNANLLISARLVSQMKKCPILPVAMSPDVAAAPPDPINHLKALRWNEATNSTDGLLPRRVGALLGLRIRNREQKLFISYRSVDGRILAQQIETFLGEHGFRTWRDEARDEYDGEGSIQAGEEVQKAIEENLEDADMLLLLDTPQASESHWINLEVRFANGQLIPVLPLLFLQSGERRKISRFRILQSLQRGCEFLPSPSTADRVLNADELATMLTEVESFLSEIFQRKLRLPFLVRQEFDVQGYDWNTRDRFIYEAVRKNKGTLRTRVFSHCAYFEGIYDPALLAYVQHYADANPRANYALYIYDGPVIPPTEMEDIINAANLEDSSDLIILNHQEVKALLNSNFTSRTL